jgi:hypothetical protein
MTLNKFVPMGLLALGLLLMGTAVRADEEAIPSFRKAKDKEGKEFVGKVFDAIVHAARAKPKNVKVEKYDYVNVKDKENRKELNITGTYDGQIAAKGVKVNVTVQLDTSNKDAWEVLNIDYKDNNKVSLLSPSAKKIQELVKTFNK